jgi:putative peptidoglycan lipid II flippase
MIWIISLRKGDNFLANPPRHGTIRAMKRTRHLLQSSIIVIVLFGLGKIAGLIRVRLIATAFGAGAVYDAFTAANQLPEVFFTLIAGGSLAAAFIPIYSDYLTNKSEQESARLANNILTLVLILLGTVSALSAILAPWLVRTLLVPDFTPEMQTLTADLMRIILIQTVLFGIGGVLSSILNAHQHFTLPALAPLSLDIGYALGLYVFVPQMGIHGLAWGTVIGGGLHIAIQLPALIRYRFRYRPTWGLQLAGTRETIRLMGPRVVTLGMIQVVDLIIINLTSALPSGSTSGYFYGYALMQLPETLFGTAIALVMFPTMAEMFNVGDVAGMKRTAVNALKIIWTLTIPGAALMVVLGEPAITIFLQGGVFDAAATRLVYSVLIVFSVRLVSESSLEILARLFYAQHNTKAPMMAYLGWLLINWSLATWLVQGYGVVGLALASTVAFTALSMALFILNRHYLGSMFERELFMCGGRALLAALGMTVVIVGIGRFITAPIPFFIFAGGAGLIVYIALNLFLGGQEIPSLIRLIRRRNQEGTSA